MHQLKDIIENKIINDLTKSFHRSPKQLNKVHETDAEIIKLDNSPYDLAITIDTISEEIKTGLYSDPYQIGWMSVMVNMSDLAAVSAAPIGLVISQILPNELSEEYLDKIQSGINDACNKCGTFVLGGDTNFGDELIISGCAIGTIEKGKYLKRVGCKAGDKIYTSGTVGTGNAYAFQKLFSKNDSQFVYHPAAKLEWGNILKKYSSSCIDTSDGILSSLDQLMRLNNVGFKFRNDWDKVIDRSSEQLFGNNHLPIWLLLAGEHGEFELLFTIPAEKKLGFLKEACHLYLKPIYLGEATEDQKISLNLYNQEQSLDTEKIRNLTFEKDFSPFKYLQKLLEIDQELKN
ncbi:MAG: thiamine-phosphate kinase [Ignavibacteriaceae bacterium]|nr:thiamine-phosphate kinase [Ignavibacteriaceae bacterium]